MLASYNRCAAAAPVATKALTAATLSGLSVVLAQAITQLRDGSRGAELFSSEQFRAVRAKAAKLFLFGLLVGGPSAHAWHAFLERAFKVCAHAPGPSAVILVNHTVRVLPQPQLNIVFRRGWSTRRARRLRPAH